MRDKGMVIALVAVLLLVAKPSWGAGAANAMVDIIIPLAATAQLTLTPTVINFSDANPDTVPFIPADSPVQVTANATTTGNKTITLTALAQGDLVSGSDIIAISNVTWTASGTGFIGGTMSKTAAQSVGQWTGSGNRTGTLSFVLRNSWSYATGNYTQRVTFTLFAP